MKKTYKEFKESLDGVIEKLQDPNTELDEALTLHQKAKELISELESYLKAVEMKVTKATKK